MTKLTLVPSSEGYSATDGFTVVSNKLDGGASRYRLDMLDAWASVDVTWTCNPEQFEYLRFFYRSITKTGSIPFTVDLAMDRPELTTHDAYFVPGSFRTTGVEGLLFTVSAQLEVKPLPITNEAALTYLYTTFSSPTAFTSFEDRLNTVVNTSLPAVNA